MPSLQGQFFNTYIRLFIRRRYGFDEKALAKKARRIFGSPRIFQWINARGLNLRSVNEEKVRGEWLENGQTGQETVFYIHGGGYVSCSAKTHRPISATLARLSRFRVFSLEYRLAPENRFPAALDDAFAAYNWLLEQNIPPSKIAFAGDSAGGGLVLALLLRLRDSNLPLPACAVCFSAWTDLTGTSESIRTNADNDVFFYPENIPEFAAAYLGETPVENPSASPIFGDYKNLPPILFHVGSAEVLLDDSRRVHQKIQLDGGTSEIEIFEDIFHCWQMGGGILLEARNSLGKASEFIRQHISEAKIL